MRLLVYPIIQACAIPGQGQLRPAGEFLVVQTWRSQWRRTAFSWLRSSSQAEVLERVMEVWGKPNMVSSSVYSDFGFDLSIVPKL